MKERIDQNDPFIRWDENNQARLDLDMRIEKSGKEYAELLMQDTKYTNIFTQAAQDQWGYDLRSKFSHNTLSFTQPFHRSLRLLLNTVKQNEANADEALQFVLAIDEATNMPERQLHTFLQTFSIIQSELIWILLLSTYSKLTSFWPADGLLKDDQEEKISARESRGDNSTKLHRIPAFSTFPVSTPDIREKSSLEAMSISNMAKVCRPLWQAYINDQSSSYQDLENIVFTKLLGGRGEALDESYEIPKFTTLKKVVQKACLFTCLTNLVLLDPVRHHHQYTFWMVSLVDGYLRWLTKWYMSSGRMITQTLNEPIVSHYAHVLLTNKGKDWTWDTALDMLATELWHENSVDRGNCGEVFVRILFVLARLSIKNIRIHTPFTVIQLLSGMFGGTDEHHSQIFSRLPQEIRKSHMTYNHFIHTKKSLSEDGIDSVCKWLLSTCSALQSKKNQERFDSGIPYQYESENGNPITNLLLIQTKLYASGYSNPADFLCSDQKNGHTAIVEAIGWTGNCPPALQFTRQSNQGSSAMWNLLHRKHSDGQKHPSLVILFDLGSKDEDSNLILYQGGGMVEEGSKGDEAIKVDEERRKDDERVFVLQVKGHDEGLFYCLKEQGIERILLPNFFKRWLVMRNLLLLKKHNSR